MKKIISLIKVAMTDNMNIFKINTKNDSKAAKVVLPLFLAAIIMGTFFGYSMSLITALKDQHNEYIVLTIFGAAVSFLTLWEGIYKSPNLLFKCKDDDLLFSLPIERRTVLFLRIFKFYLFEILFNGLFFLPSVIAYAVAVNPHFSFYLISFIALLLLPIVPILLSSIIGFFTTSLSSRFKKKNIVQIIVAFAFILFIMFFSYSSESMVNTIVSKSERINTLVTTYYYPVGAYIKLINNFNILELLLYIVIHIFIMYIVISFLGKIYFNINTKMVSSKSSGKGNYKIVTSSPIKSIVKKESKKFISSPVFVTNSAFGLVLFVFACVYISIRFNSILGSITTEEMGFDVSSIANYIPLLLYALICFCTLLSSITSSMISLEGKSFYILKSIPVKPSTIVFAKVLTAVLIIIPFILIGDIVMFIRFNFNIIEILLILLASIILPFVSEIIGILINLKYPKMDARNDTEVVKQSTSTAVAVLLGGVLTILTGALLLVLSSLGINNNLIILISLIIYSIILILLLIRMKNKSVEEFNNIVI